MKKVLYALPMFLLPFITNAKEVNFTAFDTLISNISLTVGKIIPLLVGIAVLIFLWGVLKYILSGADDPDKRKEARGFMVWGIVAIFVMISVWGLVGLLSNTLGVSGTSAPKTPQVPTVQ